MGLNGVSLGLARWSERLKDLTVTPLTRDYPEPPVYKAAQVKRPIEAVESLTASGSVSYALRTLGALASSYELLLASYVILISRLTGDDDIAIGTNARPGGPPFVLRVLFSSKDSYTDLVSKVKEVSRIQVRVHHIY
jgi:L-2-aminoadipate reductase